MIKYLFNAKFLNISRLEKQIMSISHTVLETLSNYNVKTCKTTEEAIELNCSFANIPRFYNDLDKGLNVILFPEFLSPELANHLFNLLMKIEFRSDEDSMVTIMGHKIVIPRKQTAFGVKGAKYSFSGSTVEVDDWDADHPDPNMNESLKIVRFIASRLTDKFGQKFNYALINKYPDNNSNIGYHADDENDLCENPMILGLSLGQERPICFKKGTDKPIKIFLSHNSLVAMNYPTNLNYKHSIPPSKIKMGPRVSLTFRGIS